MADQSWNPLSYSQNLCVMSGGSQMCGPSTAGTAITSIESAAEHLLDSLSALDIQRMHNSSNDDINQLVSDLMSNTDNNLPFNCYPNMSTQTNRSSIVDTRTAKPMNNAMNCGDFAVDAQSAKSALMAANEASVNQSFPFKANAGMSSHNYPDIRSMAPPMHTMNGCHPPASNQLSRSSGISTDVLSNALVNPSFNKITKTLPKPMANQSMNTSLQSAMGHMNGNQSLSSMIGCKGQLPYNQNQKYQQFVSLVETSSTDGNYAQNRPIRSIRARSSATNALEPSAKLEYYLDKTYNQFRQLEKDRKKIECELIDAFAGKKISSANNFPMHRLLQNASKMDRMMYDMRREHAKVVTITANMEQLKGHEFTDDIHNSAQKWVNSICNMDMKRKMQMQKNSQTGQTADDASIDDMCLVLKDLWATIRTVRTALWCSSVLTLYDTKLASN